MSPTRQQLHLSKMILDINFFKYKIKGIKNIAIDSPIRIFIYKLAKLAETKEILTNIINAKKDLFVLL